MHRLIVCAVVLCHFPETTFGASCNGARHIQSGGKFTSAVQNKFFRAGERGFHMVDPLFQCEDLLFRASVVQIPGIGDPCHDLHELSLDLG